MPRKTKIVALALLLGVPFRAPPPAYGQDSTIALSLDSLLNTRISTAAKYAQTAMEATSSVTIITAEDIDRYGYRTLADALDAVSGFYTSNDRVYSYLGVRGFGRPSDYNSRVLLLLDGNIVNEGVLGSAVIGSELGIPLSSLERIEIVRGPGSVLYGTGAVFAVVNLITKSAAALAGGEARVETGSYGHRGGSFLFGRQLRDGTGVTFSGMWDESDGQNLYYPEYDTPATNNGIAHHLDWERRWGVLGSFTRGGLKVHARYSSRRKAIPTASYGADFNTEPADDWARFGEADVSYTRPVGIAAELTVRSYLNVYALDARAPYFGFNFDVVGRNVLLGSEATLNWSLASSNQLTVGAEVRRHARASIVLPLPDGSPGEIDAPYTVGSAYLQDEHQLTPTVSLLGGVRYDHYTEVGGALTPRGAVIFTPARGTALKLLYGGAFRAPNVMEMHTEMLFHGVPGNVRPEKVQTAELLWQQRVGPAVLGTFSIYQYHATDLIDPRIDSSGFTTSYENNSHFKAYGMELGFEARFGHGVTGYGSYSYQHAYDDEAGTRLTNSPAHLIKGGLAAELLPWLRPAAEGRYESGRLTLYDSKTDPYVVATSKSPSDYIGTPIV
jgi:outer membrane cobalamin receptor